MMAHFYEKLLQNKIDYLKENFKILSLFCNEENYYFNGIYSSLENCIDQWFYRNIKFSFNNTCCQDSFDLINGIEDIQEKFLETCEFLLTIALQVCEITRNECINKKFKEIRKIIFNDLDLLDLDYKKIENDKLGDVIIIIPKNIELEAAIEEIDDTNVRDQLIKYNYRAYEGKPKEKENILKTVMNYVEGLLKNNDLKQLNPTLFDDLGFFINNFDVRHNNTQEGVNKTVYYNATKSNREEWLDKIYNEIIMLILMKKEKQIASDVKTLKQSV